MMDGKFDVERQRVVVPRFSRRHCGAGPPRPIRSNPGVLIAKDADGFNTAAEERFVQYTVGWGVSEVFKNRFGLLTVASQDPH